MRKLLLILALLGLTSPAIAQNTQCSDRPTADSSNACANTRFVQNHPIAPNTITNSQLAQMPAATIKGNPTNALANATDFTIQGLTARGAPDATNDKLPIFDFLAGTIKYVVPSAIAFSYGENVQNYGATGNCSSVDTTAFQNAYNAASAAGGSGIIVVPPVPNGGCYQVGAINATLKSKLIIQGSGDNSLIKVIGKDASNNWWDLSGSSHVLFRNVKIIDDGGTTIPDTLFFWSCVGTTGSCTTSGVMAGLHFDHVTIAAKSNYGFLYAYGFGNTGGAAGNANAGGGSLTWTNSTWTNTNNGPVSANPWSRNALFHIDCLNSASKTSANVTIPANGQATTCSGATAVNSYFIDAPAAFIGTHTFDNNAGTVLYTANAFTQIGGSVQCLCDSLNVVWANTQGASWNGTVFNASDGGANDLNYSVIIGGGINAVIGFYDVFWPPSLGPPIAIDAGTGAAVGGVWNLTVINNNIGTALSTPFVGKTAAGCGSFTATNNWLIAANIQFLTGANGITTCGSIDNNSILQQPGTITLTGAAVDKSLHIGGSNTAWTTFTPSPSCGTATFTVNSAKTKTLWQLQATYFEIDISIIAVGTCTAVTPLTLTLPVTANSSGGGAGRETANVGKTVGCTVLTGSASMSCEFADLTNWSNGNRITVSGVIENQ